MFKKFLMLIIFVSFVFLPKRQLLSSTSSFRTPRMLGWEEDFCLTPGMDTNNDNGATHTPNNRVYGVWYRVAPYFPVIMRWWDQIGSWSQEETISARGGINLLYNASPSIAGDSNNNVHFLWRGDPSSSSLRWLFYRAKLANGNYTQICSLPLKSNNYPNYPKIAGGKGDTAHCTFSASWGGQYRIGYAKIYPSYFPIIVDIDTVSPMNWTYISQQPAIAVDGQNRVHIVWSSYFPIGNALYNIFYRMRNSQGLWGPIETLSVFPNSRHNYNPRVAIDSEGNIHVVWEAYLTNEYYPHIAHRVKTDTGWSEVVVLQSNYHRENPSCAVDKFNNLQVVVRTNEIGPSFDIVRFVRTPEGNWEGPDTVVHFNTGSRYSPEIVATRDGNLHLFRQDFGPYTNYCYRIYYKRYKLLNFDVGIKEIISPSESIPKLPFEPKIIIQNYGKTIAQNFTVYFKIYDVNGLLRYSETKFIDSLLPNKETLLIYPSWCPETTGSYISVAIAYWPPDENRRNDTLKKNFFVYWKDIGISQIIQPKDTYPSNTKLLPTCKVKNYGTFNEFNILVKCSIPEINYFQEKTIAYMPPDWEETVVFDESITVTPGTHYAYFRTIAEGDLNPNNDLAVSSYTGGILDVGAIKIISPTGVILTDSIIPQPVSGKVKNFSDFPSSFWTYFKIYKNNLLIYIDSNYNNVPPNAEITLNFTPYFCTDTGNFITILKTALSGDINPTNDSIVDSFRVISLTPGWHKMPNISGATKLIKSGGALTSLGNKIYALVGNNTRDLMEYDVNTNTWIKKSEVPFSYFTSKKKNVKYGASICSDGESLIYVIKGNNTKEFWRYKPEKDSWKEYVIPFTKGIKGSSMTFDGANYIYIICGSNNNEWLRFNIAADSFEICNPTTLPADNWKRGSWIVYVPGDTPKIYALRVGGRTNEFYMTPIGGNWSNKKEMPLIGSTGRKKKAREGSAGVYNPDNGLIYALKGGNTLEFFSYNLKTDQWNIELDVGKPEGTPTKKVKGGGALTYSKVTHGLYAFVGNNTNEFWLYIPETSFWVVNSDGIVNKKTKNFFVIFTLTKDYLKIYYSLPLESSAKLTIYNILGQAVYQAKNNNNHWVVDTKKLGTGVYFIKLDTNILKTTKKITIKF
jgi:hypothetical protein